VNFPTRVGTWKLGSIDSLLKRIRKTGTIARQPGSGWMRSARIATRTLRRWRTSCLSGGQAKKHQSRESGIPRSSVHTAMLQTTSCSGVKWSQSRRSSHSL